MSHQAFFDALHVAQVKMREREAAAQHALTRLEHPDRETIECRECWGTDIACPHCHGSGWWRVP